MLEWQLAASDEPLAQSEQKLLFLENQVNWYGMHDEGHMMHLRHTPPSSARQQLLLQTTIPA
jgi:hypothetical protein